MTVFRNKNKQNSSFVTAYTFCASRDFFFFFFCVHLEILGFPMGGAY